MAKTPSLSEQLDAAAALKAADPSAPGIYGFRKNDDGSVTMVPMAMDSERRAVGSLRVTYVVEVQRFEGGMPFVSPRIHGLLRQFLAKVDEQSAASEKDYDAPPIRDAGGKAIDEAGYRVVNDGDVLTIKSIKRLGLLPGPESMEEAKALPELTLKPPYSTLVSTVTEGIQSFYDADGRTMQVVVANGALYKQAR